MVFMEHSVRRGELNGAEEHEHNSHMCPHNLQHNFCVFLQLCLLVIGLLQLCLLMIGLLQLCLLVIGRIAAVLASD
jgi:hypothetical protein